MNNQKSLARKSTSTNTKTQDNQFEGRGFAVQKKSDIHTQKSDLNTLFLQAKTFGHSITKLAAQESSGASQTTQTPIEQAGMIQPMLGNLIMPALLYRGMIESSGKPKIGSTARELGVRDSDVKLDQDKKVIPGTGMSTAKGSPENLPKHRRSSSWGGTGKDRVWEIEENAMNGKLKANHDGGNHVSITTATQDMSLKEFQQQLAATQPNWAKTPEPGKK
ncbi:hypothetical protein PN456_04230 [Nodularia spumigena CS-586/05]|uniref:Tse2 family ADP-ribosyltransferase toxin n=1 Tax=Nodularia spumigena TaxID=70799 RepID=UPI00232B8882|nr:hypothetical protein [Nodularia spumigena]MDB9343305.1 hypothetical protein [Nodularia spumigena CS-588/06]MDB9368168.1 hypothetical protein [Nodularia spumigena CS-586/05]